MEIEYGVLDPSGSGRNALVERDSKQWIALQVPPIVSQANSG
jgi:hypothetical protein